MSEESFDPAIWGPHFWFFLHTVARAYPASPSEIMRKKYYTFYQDLPVFLPVQSMGNSFAKLMDKYPVSPYLSSRVDLIKWTNYIHNKVNAKLLKEQVPFDESTRLYWSAYAKAGQVQKKTSSLHYVVAASLVALGLVLSVRKTIVRKMTGASSLSTSLI